VSGAQQMKAFALSRSALSVSAAAVFLGGCGGSQPPIGAPGATPQTSALAARIDSTNYKIVHSFGAVPDGNRPNAPLIDVNGTLYGTTYEGGKYDKGTVFSITTTGTEHVLHSFGRPRHDGTNPSAGLIDVGGTLYGTTREGGAGNLGTVFSISTSGVEHVLHSFGNTDGAFPEASLIDVKGTLYGTTSQGGAETYGTVFSISTTGSERVLHSFDPGTTTGARTDGMFPEAGLIDVKGTLYGTTREGGTNSSQGTVFSISTSGVEHVLYSFGNTDGAYPAASLIDVKGTLYGTTTSGGAYSVGGGGTVFSISTSGVEHVLHSFGRGQDGAEPAASLIDVSGTLYGTTVYGGKYSGSFQGGTVFSVTTSGAERVLHSFDSGSDGALPDASLMDLNSTLYGTTYEGGEHGEGTVFALGL
jgi:uncharacterized repeat protein (TIGR03803 family)